MPTFKPKMLFPWILLLISTAYACQNQNSTVEFDIELKVKTSECRAAGTDGPLYIYFVDEGKSPFKFAKSLGPFQLDTGFKKYEKGTLSTQTIKWSEISKKATDSSKICFPKLDTVIIEKSYYNSVVPNLFSAWKPVSIELTVAPLNNQTAPINNTFTFSPSCNNAWIDENAFYQIGPARGQLQNLGNTYDDIFE